MNIDTLHTIWGITPQHIVNDEFTGYESVYYQLDKFTKEVYDKDPEGTIDRVFEIYRTIGLVPITYYTEQGVKDALKKFKHQSYNSVNNSRIGLGNNQGQNQKVEALTV